MPTSLVNLDTTQYVQINNELKPLILQSLNDSVRIAISELKPAIGNTAFHTLGGKDDPLNLSSIDTNIWALAVTNKSSLIVSEIDYLVIESNTANLFRQGRTFSGTYIFNGLPNDGFINVLMRTKDIVAVTGAGIYVAGDFQTWVFESPTITAAGTPLISKNFNRPASIINPSPLTDVFLNPTVTADGEELFSALVLGGAGALGSTTPTTAIRTGIQKPNTDYLFRFQNLSGQAESGNLSWSISE